MQLSPKHTYRDSAFVVRTQQLGDADKIVILLTRKFGLVHAVAKSARKGKSKFGARLEPFMMLDVSFVYQEKLSLLNQVMTQQAYAMPLMGDYRSYLLGSLLNELVEKFERFGEHEEYFFTLLHGAIAALAHHRYDSVDVANAFMLRILKRSGWALSSSGLALRLSLSAGQTQVLADYCDALLDSRWDSIAGKDLGHLPLVVFSEVTDHIRSVLELDLLTLPMIQKELFGGR